jgi:hypothetical protein
MVLGVKVFFLHQLSAISTPRLADKFLSIFTEWFPVQLGHELNRPQMWFWVAMAFDAPCHRQFLGLVHHFHLVDAAVACFATNA